MNSLTEPLFQALDLRSLHLPNRTVMAPMGRLFAKAGVPSADAPAYYAQRAAGGVGLIITEASGIDHPLATDHPGVPLLHGAEALAAWRAVVDAVHAAGGRIVPQLFHQGMLRGGGLADPTMESLRPSGIIGPAGANSFDPVFVERASQPTRAMTDSEIADVIAAFARTAATVVALGFDGIEIHGAHGYLVDSFLWDQSNRRSDRWGGDHRKRTAFAVEVVKAVRAAMPDDMPLLLRFSQHKSHNYDACIAATPQQLAAILEPIADAGVDAFDASMRRFWQAAFEGSPLNLAGWAKKITGKPAIAVGSIGLDNTASDTLRKQDGAQQDNVPLLMERFNAGEFDLVGIGRSLIGDAHYVRKLRTREPVNVFTRAALQTLE